MKGQLLYNNTNDINDSHYRTNKQYATHTRSQNKWPEHVFSHTRFNDFKSDDDLLTLYTNHDLF